MTFPKLLTSKLGYGSDSAPREIYNWTLYLSITVFGILGAGRGIDEAIGSSTSTLPAGRQKFGFNDPEKSKSQLTNLKSNITAMVQLGSIGGAFIGMAVVDKIGRVWAVRELCVLWIVSVIIQMTSRNVGQLYAGRLIEGFAIGQTVCCGPVYISEVTPKAIRGLTTSCFCGAVYLGAMLGYFAVYSAALHNSDDTNMQWIVPMFVKIAFAVVIFAISWFCIESPRWLIKVGRNEEALTNMSKLRNLPVDHPYLLSEISDIEEGLQIETNETKGNTAKDVFMEFVSKPSMRYRVCVVFFIQFFSQWTLAGSFSSYTANIASMVGFQGNRSLLMSSVLGVVKFVASYLCAFFLIDVIGRKWSMHLGIAIQFFTVIFFGIFVAVVPEAADKDVILTGSKKKAAQAALAAMFINGAGWCIGWNNMQYLFNAEVFPLRVRNIATAISMVLHFAFQYSTTESLPHLMNNLHHGGTFFLSAGIILAGEIFIWFFIPEVAGRSLESMEPLFELPWYQIGRYGNKLCPDHTEVTHVKEAFDHDGNAAEGKLDVEKQEATHIENGTLLNKSFSNTEKSDDLSPKAE